MTSRATFGDFANAAGMHLEHAASPAGSAVRLAEAKPRTVPAEQFARSLDSFLTVMARYLSDVTAPVAEVLASNRHRLGPWARAGVQAQDALRNAAKALRAGAGRDNGPSRRPGSGAVTCGLDAAAACLTTGRDLLHTHLSTAPDGTRLDRTEWGPVITSAPVVHALMLELGIWARQVAAQGGEMVRTRAPGRRAADDARSRVDAACQWLWQLHSGIQAAQYRSPVATADTMLLYAIPANVLPARAGPASHDTVPDLCQGAAGSAERLRHLLRAAVPQASWSPYLTADTLREAAACGTAISHHCAIVLQSLAFRSGQQQVPAPVSTGLLEAAAAAANARGTWLQAARAWQNLSTENRGRGSATTAEAVDLAAWTGRLAFADPEWTLAQGPRRPARPPESLAPGPGDLQAVVGAVHEASDALARMAAADHARIRALARNRRLHSPTRTLPEHLDIPRPYGPAPDDRIGALLAAYHDATAASAVATATAATVATDIRAPSQTLAAARAAVRTGSVALPAQSRRSAAMRTAAPLRSPDLPGPFERILRNLGVSAPDTLLRAAAIDQEGGRLVLEATQAARARPASASREASSPPVAAEPGTRALTTGSPRTATASPRPTAEQVAEAEL